ncbi:MAG: sulfatase-like hydrolase/transferase [bacterium]|nr:sulfatase-like hydrolase/transferase [bacterium]
MEPGPPRPRPTWPFRLWLFNLALGCWIGRAWLAHGPEDLTPSAWCFATLALVSTIALLSLVPFLALRLTTFWMSLGWARGVHAVVWTLFQGALFVDTRIYNLFRYHFNGMVWNVLTAPDAGDSVQLSTKDWTMGVGGLVVLLIVEFALAAWLARRVSTVHVRWLSPRWVWGLFLLPTIVVEKGLYAYADLNRDLEVTALARLFPLYQRLTVKQLAEEVFAMDLGKRPEVRVNMEGVLLDYPKQPVAAPADGPRPNVLILVIDSLRVDALEPETMPFLAEYAQGARTFSDHISGGNATRFGLFSIIYGMHGPYWHQVYEEKRSPVLVDVLLDAGYDLHVFSTASMSSPEFRSTAWVRIEEHVTDRMEARTKHARDTLLGEKLVDWVGQRADTEKPFFAFGLLDSPHQRYSFPKKKARFAPFATKIDYVDLSDDLDAETLELLHNGYKNAVHHTDGIVRQVLAGLDELGVLDDTLVMITGDHGEEFGENGFWGHTSNFTRAQIQVPFVLAGPGVEAGVETEPTSHLDVPATILESLGVARDARADYTLGGNLLEPGDTLRLASGWDTMGLLTDDAIIVVPFAAYEGMTRGYTSDWKPMEDDQPVLDAESGSLVRIARECARFLR